MDLKNLTAKAKELIDKRGGTGSLKEDAGELKGIASQEGSLVDKAKDALGAIKDPGADDVSATAPAPTDAPAPEAAPPERERRDGRGKGGRHGAGGGQGRQGRGGQGRGRRGGRDGGRAV